MEKKNLAYAAGAIIILAAVAVFFAQTMLQPKTENSGIAQAQPAAPKTEISDLCKQFAAAEQESCSKAIKSVELSAANSTAYKAEKAENDSWIVYVESVTVVPSETIITPTGEKINPSDIKSGEIVKLTYIVNKTWQILPREIIR